MSSIAERDWRGLIEAAAARITPYLRDTPAIALAAHDTPFAGTLGIKLESLQHSGTFKARGAFNNLLSRSVPASGVIAASGGNHGAAVAYAARRLGHAAEIFVPGIAAQQKIERLRSYGATLEVVGADYAETLEACRQRQVQTGAMEVHAYDSEATVAGQGTIAREMASQLPDLDTVLVAVGGGGLIGGVAAWYQGAVKVVAVETFGTATLDNALRAGVPVTTEVSGLAADALGARLIGEHCLCIAQAFVASNVLVDDDAVRTAQAWLWSNLRVIAEPAGATALAALLCGAYAPGPDERVGVIVCGANTDPGPIAALPMR